MSDGVHSVMQHSGIKLQPSSYVIVLTMSKWLSFLYQLPEVFDSWLLQKAQQWQKHCALLHAMELLVEPA